MISTPFMTTGLAKVGSQLKANALLESGWSLNCSKPSPVFTHVRRRALSSPTTMSPVSASIGDSPRMTPKIP